MIDFDNAAWGYRAFDIVYHFVHYTFYPKPAKQEDFLLYYIAEYNRLSDEKVTMGELLREIKDHEPYVLLEQENFSKKLSPLISYTIILIQAEKLIWVKL